MQNKAKFRKSQMNVSDDITREYVQMDTWSIGTKQSQTNPNKAKLKKAKMNVTSAITKAYENKPPIRAPKKQSQTSKRQKPMQTSLPQRIMKKTALSGPGKTKPNKPNSTPKQSQSKPIKANFCTIGSAFCLQLHLMSCELDKEFCVWISVILLFRSV